MENTLATYERPLEIPPAPPNRKALAYHAISYRSIVDKLMHVHYQI